MAHLVNFSKPLLFNLMPTENRRVAAYLPKELDEKLEAFKSERGIKGDSQALILILSEFLGVSQPVAYSSSFVTLEKFEDLASQVAILAEKLEAFSNSSNLTLEEPLVEVSSELPVEISDELLVEPIVEPSPTAGDRNTDLFISATNVDVVVPPSASTVTIQAVELSKRLKVGQSTLSTKKKSSHEEFAAWTRSKDPNSVAWAYLAETNKFQPIGDISPEVLSELHSEPPIGIATIDLARRLGVDGSTLSHAKKGRTLEELTEWIRKKDPEGIGWVLLPEVNRFRPESEISSSSRSILQGDLLNAESLTQVSPAAPKGSERSGEG